MTKFIAAPFLWGILSQEDIIEEKRKFTRIKFEAKIVIFTENQEYTGILEDISLKGALIRLDNKLPISIGENCLLKIFLPNSEYVIEAVGNLAHYHNFKHGFEFVSQDIESFYHLKKMIKYNMSDNYDIDKELKFLSRSID